MIEFKTDNNLKEFPYAVMHSIEKSIFETFAEVGFYFVKKKVPETFRNKGKRDDNPEWKPLSIFTIAERLARHGGKYTSKSQAKKMLEKDGYIPIQKIMAERKSMPILVDTAQLINSYDIIEQKYNEKEALLRIGSKLNYAVKHQFGDKTNNIPQRKMIFVTDDDKREIMEILMDNIGKNLS